MATAGEHFLEGYMEYSLHLYLQEHSLYQIVQVERKISKHRTNSLTSTQLLKPNRSQSQSRDDFTALAKKAKNATVVTSVSAKIQQPLDRHQMIYYLQSLYYLALAQLFSPG